MPLPTAHRPTGAAVAARRAAVAARALARSVRSAPPRVDPVDVEGCRAAIARLGDDIVRETAVVHVPAGRKPWTAAGIRAETGAPLTWLAHGDSWLLTRSGPHVG